MKKSILLSIMSLVVVLQLSAQVESGSLIVGGTLGFSSSSSEFTFDDGTTSTTTEGPKYSSFEIMPWAVYMLSENFGAGAGIGFSSASEEYTYIDFLGDDHTVTNKTTMFTIAPMARYYYVHMDMTHLWMQLSIPIGSGKITSDDVAGGTTVSTESTISSFGVGITPGFTLNIGEVVGFEASYGFLGFSSSTMKTTVDPTTSTSKSSGFGLEWAESFGFGIVFQL